MAERECACVCVTCVYCVYYKRWRRQGGKQKKGEKKQNSVSAESSAMNLHILWAHMYPAVLGPAILRHV